MDRTRWKIMIGGLGLALGGLAAVAGVPAANGVSCAGSPTHTVARVGDPPVPVPAPKAADLKPSEPVTPAPATIPAIGLPELPSAPVALPVPALPEPIFVNPLPLPVPLPAVVHTLPAIPQGLPPIPVNVAPANVAVPLSAPIPATSTESVQLFREVPNAPVNLPLPPTPVITRQVPSPTAIPPQTFVVQAEPVSPPKSVLPPPPERAMPIDADRIPPASVVPTPTDAPKLAERKLKVILSMGDERPRFEVRDGDEIYLKVVCDRVEVKSPGEGGVSVSTMRASGKVTFVTPGGEGTCDELAVLPGTGQVIVTGKVSFTYNWGKVETTVTGEKMNFRLGSNTVTPSAAAGVTGVPASYTRTR